LTLKAKQIHKLAKLAKLDIDDQAMDQISGQLDNIMQLIDQLQAADTAGVEPLSHPQDPSLRLREDTVTAEDRRDDFMQLTPNHQDGLYLVPKVIE
jgi:aspartyl-tRNA(Asn)/glutamyl-tRNA(Gln) amidotransferase subunit C